MSSGVQLRSNYCVSPDALVVGILACDFLTNSARHLESLRTRSGLRAAYQKRVRRCGIACRVAKSAHKDSPAIGLHAHLEVALIRERPNVSWWNDKVCAAATVIRSAYAEVLDRPHPHAVDKSGHAGVVPRQPLARRHRARETSCRTASPNSVSATGCWRSPGRWRASRVYPRFRTSGGVRLRVASLAAADVCEVLGPALADSGRSDPPVVGHGWCRSAAGCHPGADPRREGEAAQSPAPVWNSTLIIKPCVL